MKKGMLIAFATLLLPVVMSCNKIDDDIPVPPPPCPPYPPVEMKEVALKATIMEPPVSDSSVLFVNNWNDGQVAIALPLSSSQVAIRTSVMNYRVFPLHITDGFGTSTARLEGTLEKNIDSVMLIKLNKEMYSLNFIERHYDTDSLLDVFRYDDVLAGSARLDSSAEQHVRLKHLTSILDVRFLNKTGIDLAVRKVTIYPVDPECIPFYRSLDFLVRNSYGTANKGSDNLLTATYNRGRVGKNAVFTVRHPLFLVNDSILNGKSLIYSIQTDHGVYTYTKPGRIYEGGLRHVEEITLEGQ